MRKLVLVIFSAFALSNVSCQHDKCCTPPPPPPVMTAEKNGDAWLLPIIKGTISNDKNIFVSTVGPYLLNTAKDSLSISLAYTGLGSYTPTDQQLGYTVFTNGVKTKYVLDTTFYNLINITEFAVPNDPPGTTPDPTALKATFTLRFVDPAHTTSVTFSNGKFTALLSQ
ncbi:MAG: hypothetical protein ACHQHN_01965 [Sphingobacteriales bacterium]